MASRREAELAAEGRRRALGAWYTPAAVVDAILDRTLDPLLDQAGADADPVAALRGLRVVDPACGTGNFLVPVVARIASALCGQGFDPGDATLEASACIVGADLDPGAVAACRSALPSAATLVEANSLLLDSDAWRAWAPDGFDLVVGNPPFGGQLRRETSRDAATRKALRSRFGPVAGAYTDPAALFLALATELARPDGGTTALVLPVPMLTTRDAAAVRDVVLGRAALTDIWFVGEGAFEASVDVCIATFTNGASPDVAVPVRIGLREDLTTTAAPPSPGHGWSDLVATAAGAPDRALRTNGTVADLATATADFRDQYYGLVGAVVDAPGGDRSTPRLVTAGLIDPAHLAWGARPTRFAKTTYAHPRVDLAALHPRLASWASERLVPKLLVATQTRVLEAIADLDGTLLPSVPVLTVVPIDRSDIDRLGALFCSPPIALVAVRRHLGGGRNRDALKLRASELLELPLPVDHDAWDEAAAAFRRASDATDADRVTELEVCALAMNRAFGLGEDPDLLEWWRARVSPRRR